MNSDTVVKAELVENLTLRGNKIVRTDPDLVFGLSQDALTVQPDVSDQAGISLSGRQRTGSTENMYELT